MSEQRAFSFSSRSFLFFLLVTFLILFLDQATKYASEVFLSSRQSLPVIRGVFHLTLVHNRGAAFGVLKGGGVIFIIATVLCLVAILSLLANQGLFRRVFDLEPKDALLRFSLALIFAGAAGNLIDRLRFSYVIDFLDFRVWPVFNVADSAITIGGILIFYRMVFGKQRSL